MRLFGFLKKKKDADIVEPMGEAPAEVPTEPVVEETAPEMPEVPVEEAPAVEEPVAM